MSTVGRRAVVEIADDGPGIDAAVLPRVFERFATAGAEHTGVSRRYKIGLALVGDVIARHGGTADARNQPDGGACSPAPCPRSPRQLQGSAATLGTDRPEQTTRPDPRMPMPIFLGNLPVHPLVVHAVVVLVRWRSWAVWSWWCGPPAAAIETHARLGDVQVYRIGDSGAQAAWGDRQYLAPSAPPPGATG